jgi:hypothetical protein
MEELKMTEKISLNLTLEELEIIDKYIELNDDTRQLFDKIRSAYPKSPVEAAYKRVYGAYPITDIADTSWGSDGWTYFKAGYNAAYEEKVSQEPEDNEWTIEKLQENNWYVDTKTLLKSKEPEEEPEELKTLYQMVSDNSKYKTSDEICNIVKEWMSQYTHNVMTGEYLKGYEECLLVLEENLK